MIDFENVVWEMWFAWIVGMLILGYVIWLLIISNKKNGRKKIEINDTLKKKIAEEKALKKPDKMQESELREYLRIRIDKDMN